MSIFCNGDVGQWVFEESLAFVEGENVIDLMPFYNFSPGGSPLGESFFGETVAMGPGELSPGHCIKITGFQGLYQVAYTGLTLRHGVVYAEQNIIAGCQSYSGLAGCSMSFPGHGVNQISLDVGVF
jgi:hypothetical protein